MSEAIVPQFLKLDTGQTIIPSMKKKHSNTNEESSFSHSDRSTLINYIIFLQ